MTTNNPVEIRFEDLNGRFENCKRLWYHVPRQGDWIELYEDDKQVMAGNVAKVMWGDDHVTLRLR